MRGETNGDVSLVAAIGADASRDRIRAFPRDGKASPYETRVRPFWTAPSALVGRPGEPRLVFDYPCEARWPHSIVAVAREGFRRGGDMTTGTLLMSIRLARLSFGSVFVRLSDRICVVRLIAQPTTGEQHFDQECAECAHCEKQRQTKRHE